MKISIGMKLQEGAFGGGNQFARQLVDFLRENGHIVVFDLEAHDIDLILLTDPRSYLDISNYGASEIRSYLLNVNSKALVVHRINECDERKNTKHMNEQLLLGNSVADHTVYISGWLRDLFTPYGINKKSHNVIVNGGDHKVFRYSKRSLPSEGKIRIVTHHFSSNLMKGWDAYLKLDQILASEKWASRFELHYIGNKPTQLPSNNIIFHAPEQGAALAHLLSENHLYITASLNEPCGNHQIEGCLVGLPILYRLSGALPETCSGFGVSFKDDLSDLENSLESILENYEQYQSSLKNYPLTGQNMCSLYVKTFQELIGKREELIKNRSLPGAFPTKIAELKFRVLDRIGKH